MVNRKFSKREELSTVDENRGKSCTLRQEKVIRAVLECRSIEEACKTAGVSKSLYYKWLKIPAFAEALKTARETVTAEALNRLERSLGRAVDTLVRLLNSKSEGVRRYVANDIITHFLKARELRELEERMANLEKSMGEQANWRR